MNSPLVIAPSQGLYVAHRHNPDSSTRASLTTSSDGNDGPWSSFALSVGTPPQTVHVLISTTAPQPWVVVPAGCTQEDPQSCGSSRGGLFYSNESTTWDDAGLYALDTELNLGYNGNGDFGFDTITLGYPGSGVPVVEHQILAGIAAKDFYIATWGIAPRPTNLTELWNSTESLISTLKRSHQIPSLSYGYTAGAKYRLKEVLASLTLGGYDASKFVSSDLLFDFAPDNSRDLVVGIQSITYDISEVSHSISGSLLSQPILSFIDSTVSHVWLPIDVCQAFERVFGLVYDPLSELYLVNDSLHESLLAQNPSFTFRIATDDTSSETVNITLPYASFDQMVTTAYPNVTNSSSYFPLRRAANDSQYTLGRAFLQESYLIADYERSQFSINQCIFSENMTENIRAIPALAVSNTTGSTPTVEPPPLSRGLIAITVILPILFVILLGSIFTFILRRRRQKREQQAASAAVAELVEGTEVNSAGNELYGDTELMVELHGEQSPMSELHGLPKVIGELQGTIGAHEVMGEVMTVHELPA
ncbi:hypothetical protein MMC17_007464 [Xylographa soralifera]|nr:hypothetical protein [Xylographa soralifera]